MAALTLTTLVLKTATAGSVTLLTPADRIGQGFGAAKRGFRADVPNPGHVSMPPYSHPEQEREYAHGSTPSRRGSWLAGLPMLGWRLASKPAAAVGKFLASLSAGDPGEVGLRGGDRRKTRPGDCQSPDRLDGRTAPNAAATAVARDADPAATAVT